MNVKLIDILVRELPKRGGWPERAEYVVQDFDDTEFYFFTGGPVRFNGASWWFADVAERDDDSAWIYSEGSNEISDDHDTSIISREQYEAALAASKPEWDGEGLPPVGEKCEFISNGTSWGEVYVIGIDGGKVVFRPSGETYYGIAPSQRQIFRPIRSETDKKKEEAIKQICDVLSVGKNTEDDAKNIYEYIKSGKIVID